jgi:hypothetical protein
MRQRCCHYCGQVLPEHRLGVKMTPREGQVFDHIVAAGAGGISFDDICELTGRNSRAISVRMFHINEKLSETGYQIVGRGVKKLMKTGKRYHASDALTEAQQKAMGL